jgi:predicted Zn-dependent protease
MIRFFETLHRHKPEGDHLLAYLSSHPSTESRIQALQQALQPADSALAPLLPSVHWESLRTLCRPAATPTASTDNGSDQHASRS